MESRWIWPFELLDKLGEGGMGVVYRARYVRNDRQVAVKLLPSVAAENKVLLARFEREMDVLKQLDHPNIVHCFGGTCESKERFYAMELVDGGTLSDVIREKGRLSWEVAVDYAIQMCGALQYAHERGIIHRDVKPSNFLVTKQGQLKLSDFGLVTVAAGRRLTATGRTLGTIDYMSPEQIRGKPGVSNRSDLYALGCVMHEMLTGQPPYSGEQNIEVLHKHLKEPIPRIARTQLDTPLELDQLVYELLAKSADQRPESATIVSQRLQDILQPGRRFKGIEPTLFATRTSINPVAVAPIKDADSDSLSEISIPTLQAYASWNWAITLCLLLICFFSWKGWATATSRVRQAEQVLANQLLAPDQAARVFAASSLAKFGPLQSATILKLNDATKDTHQATAVAALEALELHASECRSLQWEIYKIQQQTSGSEAVRFQASKTVDAIQRSHSIWPRGSLLFWSGLVTLVAGTAACGWWLSKRVRSITPPLRRPTHAM